RGSTPALPSRHPRTGGGRGRIVTVAHGRESGELSFVPDTVRRKGDQEGQAMGLVTYVNGAFVPKDEAKISVYDHGYLYGDGVFEGIRAYDGRIFRLDAHLDRLYESAQYVML